MSTGMKTKISIFFVLLFYIPLASANYALNGQCFAEPNEAIDSFTSMFPQLDTTSGNSVWWTVYSILLVGNTFKVKLVKDSVIQPEIFINVADCTTQPNFDPVLAGSLWTLAFSFVVGLYLVSRSAGTILNFIRGRA